jgi:polar amino acid transport system substrate-binding protein
MNFIRCMLITFVFYFSPLYAVGEPLNIGIESFVPPFAMQGANNESYGYDVDMMLSLCKIMQHTCQFHVMRFDKLLPAVIDHKVDASISAITITTEREKIVSFSLPYLLSYSRFLTNKTSETQQPFSLEILNNTVIGIGAGTIFGDQIKTMGIKNPTIKTYDSNELLLEGLSTKEVNFILLDNPTAIYWAANSTGSFITAGPPFMFGLGFGIALNKSDEALLDAINKALLQYQASKEYKINYDRYLTEF